MPLSASKDEPEVTSVVLSKLYAITLFSSFAKDSYTVTFVNLATIKVSSFKSCVKSNKVVFVSS